MNQKLQYYCANCNTVLEQLDGQSLHHIMEPCPHCGTFLSESLQRRFVAAATPQVVFQNASKIPRMKLGIEKLDLVLGFICINQIVGISGYDSQKLVERLCVRATLPARYGGLDSNVILIDAANSSEPYLCVSFARQYGLHPEDTLAKIISSRAFTVYQLASLVIYELYNVIKKYEAKIVIISDLFGLFEQPYIDATEAKNILQKIIDHISKLHDCLIIISMPKSTKYDYMIDKLLTHTIKISKQKHTVLITVDGKDQFIVKPEELDIVLRG